jgi:glycosyltransferase involved in cell wall biosynthesis
MVQVTQDSLIRKASLREQQDKNIAALKVLSVVTNPAGWHHKDSVGGGEVRAVEIMKVWHSLGVSVTSIECRTSPSRVLGANYRTLLVRRQVTKVSALGDIVSSVLGTIDAVRLGRKFIRKVNCVIAFTTNLTDVVPVFLLSKIYRRRMIVACVTVYPEKIETVFSQARRDGVGLVYAISQTIGAIVSLTLSKYANIMFYLSNPIRESLIHARVPLDRIAKSGSGVAYDRLSILEKTKEYEAVYIGRVDKAKGLDDLVDVWHSLSQNHPSWRLLIIGDGPYYREICTKVNHLGMQKNISFAGNVSGYSRFDLLAQGKLLVLLSRSEGWPVSLMEGLACGLPVVSYDIPAVRDNFASCQSVRMVPAFQVSRAKDEIERLLLDPVMLQRYSVGSRRFVARFSWEAVAHGELNEIMKASSENGACP